MTEAEIWFNYQQAMAQASELDEIANSLENTSNGAIADGLNATIQWRGCSAKQFQLKGEQLRENVCGTARRLHAAAAEVRKAAKKMQEIELANLALILEET